MGWENKLIQYENSFSDNLHQQVITAVQWGYPDSRTPCDKPKQAFIALICCGKYISVSMPVHGVLIDIMSRTAISWTALGTNWVYSS